MERHLAAPWIAVGRDLSPVMLVKIHAAETRLMEGILSTKTIVADAEAAAQLALTNSPIFALRELVVETDDDHLVISGRVPTFYYKQLAQEAVRAVLDDIQVINDISVD